MKVYLAGGMRTTWQDELIAALPNVVFLDPRSHGLNDPAAYTAWDLNAIREADAVVACMTSDNPSGYGLSLEVGFAYALGKPVYFIDGVRGDWRSRYFDMHREVATAVCSFAEVVKVLA